MDSFSHERSARVPWNKRKLTGQKVDVRLSPPHHPLPQDGSISENGDKGAWSDLQCGGRAGITPPVGAA